MAIPPEDLSGNDKFIPALDINNPPGIDQSRRFGDDHLRGIKNVLNNCFEFVASKVSATGIELGYCSGARSNLQQQIDDLSVAATFGFWVTNQAIDGLVHLDTSNPDGVGAGLWRNFSFQVVNAPTIDRSLMAKAASSINGGAWSAPVDAFFINAYGAGGFVDGYKAYSQYPGNTTVAFRFWGGAQQNPTDQNFFYEFTVKTYK